MTYTLDANTYGVATALLHADAYGITLISITLAGGIYTLVFDQAFPADQLEHLGLVGA